MPEKREPKLEEVVVSASFGGKVGLVKYDLSADYHLSQTRRYSIPEDYTNEMAEAFQEEAQGEIQKAVDARAQVELDKLLEQSTIF